MPGTITRLAGRLYGIAGDGSKSVLFAFGLDSQNHLAFSGTPKTSFDYLELYDNDGTLRVSMRVVAGKFSHFNDNHSQSIILTIRRPWPLAAYPLMAASGRSFRSDVTINIPIVGMFNADKSLNATLIYTSAYSANSLPGRQHIVSGVHSLKSYSNPGTAFFFEGPIFATEASMDLAPTNYPVFGQMLLDPSAVVFKDVKPLTPTATYPNPRPVGIRPIGVRRVDPATGSADFLTFGARAQIAPSSHAGSITLVMDARDAVLDTLVPVTEAINFDLIPDVFHQRDLAAGATKADKALYSYLWARPVPPQCFASVWNERIARPYLTALRTAEDARDLSFVPVFESVHGASAFEALFDVVQPDIAASDATDDIVVAAIRPVEQAATFAADAIFPCLAGHDGAPVRRRVTVTVERENLERTFGWFDTSQPVASSIPEINIRIEAEDTNETALRGQSLRFGAVDIDLPENRVREVGRLEISFSATFDPANPKDAHYATQERDPKGQAARARLPRSGEAIPRIKTRIDRFDLCDVRPGSQDPVPDAGRAFGAVIESIRRQQLPAGDVAYAKVEREKRIARNLAREAPILVVDQAAVDVEGVETPFFLKGEEITETRIRWLWRWSM